MISKHFICSTGRRSRRLQTMMTPRTAYVEAFIADPRRPSPFTIHLAPADGRIDSAYDLPIAIACLSAGGQFGPGKIDE